MTARTVPTMPTWASGQRVLASQLQAITTWNLFWANPPSFRMYQAITQSVATSTLAALLLDTLDYDTDSGRAVGTPWAYTIPPGMTGRWRFAWKGAWALNGTGYRLSGLYRNGSGVSTSQGTHAGPAGVNDEVPGPGLEIVCTAGDVMTVQIFQTTGSPLSTEVTGPSFFEGRLVSLASP